MTAPEFRPFERKFKGKRRLGPAKFLRSEEGGDWDEGSESESEDDGESYAEPETPVSKKRKRESSSSKTIYIDQVMQRASQYVIFVPNYEANDDLLMFFFPTGLVLVNYPATIHLLSKNLLSTLQSRNGELLRLFSARRFTQPCRNM